MRFCLAGRYPFAVSKIRHSLCTPVPVAIPHENTQNERKKHRCLELAYVAVKGEAGCDIITHQIAIIYRKQERTYYLLQHPNLW